MTDFTPRYITTAFQRSDAFYRQYELSRDQWLRDHPKHSAEEYLEALRKIMRNISGEEK